MIEKLSGREQTLCWSCRNAVPTADGSCGCSWSKRYVPVKGWNALRRDVAVMKYKRPCATESYMVKDCPEFIEG